MLHCFAIPVSLPSLAMSAAQVMTKVYGNNLETNDRGKPVIGLVPQSTMMEFYLPIESFNLGRDSKNGCRVFETSRSVIML